MKKFIVFGIIALCFFTLLINAQITFNKTYDFGVDNSFDLVETASGYIPLIISGIPFYPKKIE